jgi:hypothetical protein
MGRAYAQDLRERVMAAVDSGTGAYAAASLLRVIVSYIYKLLGRRLKTLKGLTPYEFICKRWTIGSISIRSSKCRD